MHLYNSNTSQLESFPSDQLPPFVVVSHNYSSQGGLRRQGLKWLPVCPWFIQLVRIVGESAIHYIWEDSLCIDLCSSEAQEEAVNGCARRLRNCSFCFVFLQDLPTDGPDFDPIHWQKSSYWTKASALPEFVIPSVVKFYDQQLNFRGFKSSPELLPLITNASRIPARVLEDSSILPDTGLNLRISWAANKSADREEEVIYALIPILGISLQLRFGEGATSAILRIQEEVCRNTTDGSIFAWLGSPTQRIRGLFAHSPSEFINFISASGRNSDPPRWTGPLPWPGEISFSNKGAHIKAPSLKGETFSLLDIGNSSGRLNPAIRLRGWNGSYVRVMADEHLFVGQNLTPQNFVVARDVSPRLAATISSQFNYQDVHGTGMGTLPFNYPPPPPLTYRPRVNSMDAAVRAQTHYQSLPKPGMKRQWSNRSVNTSDSDESNSSDEDTSDGLGSSSESDAGSDSYTGDEGDRSPEPYRLGPDHGFQAERPGLVDECCNKFIEWKGLARYRKPAQDRLPPRKRAKPMESDIEDEMDQEDPDLVVLRRHSKGFYHLACPYYLHNQDKYRSCIMDHDLQSMEALIRHVKDHHTQPPYCPICRRPFERCMERDIHVRERKCQLGQFEPVDGVNERQKRLLKKRDKLSLPESERWGRVWETVFPNEPAPRSAYLNKGIGKDLSLLLDCWERHGMSWVEEYLQKQNKLSQNQPEEELAIDALSALTLQDLKERLYKTKALSDA